MKFLAEVRSDLRQSLRDKNYRKAAELQEVFDQLRAGLKDGNSFGGFDNEEALEAFIQAYHKSKSEGLEDLKNELMKKIHDIKLKQQTNKAHIDKLKKDYTRERKETNIVKKDLRAANKDAYSLTRDLKKTESTLNRYK